MTHPPLSPVRALLGALAAMAAAVLVLGPSPAAAHGGDGEMELVATTRGEGDAVELVIRLTYVDDGHGVPDATVTAVVGEDAATPLTAGDEEGIYQGTVDAPLGSTIRVTSVEPVVTLEVAAPSDDPTTTADDTTTTAPTTATPTTAAPTTAAPTTDGTTTTPEGTAVLVEDDDGLSTGAVVAIAGGTAAVAAVGVGAALAYGRRRPQDGPGGGPGPDDGGPSTP